MIQWEDTMLLYHGSYCAVMRPDLAKCNPLKDFGRGFYLTTSREQAIRFVPSAVKRVIRSGRVVPETSCGVVTTYRFENKPALRLLDFREATVEWLHCVAAHRLAGSFPEVIAAMDGYDILAGKIANDQTNATLTAYLSGLFGEVGSAEADEFCISRLMPERLENQLCFRSTAALECLTYAGEERICLMER